MANSRYDYHKEEERLTEPRFNRGTYIIVRIDGHKFHEFSSEHKFDKPNDKRALDLMVDAAKQVMRAYKGDIPLAYGHSDEFSFMIKSSSNFLSRRVYKITSMLPVIFATHYNSKFHEYFGDTTKRKYDAWFDARPKEYANYQQVIDYYKWRQIDCHINNLYNTTLHALTGRYIKHELVAVDASDSSQASGDARVIENNSSASGGGGGSGTTYRLKKTPITEWICKTQFMPSKEATDKLSKTVSSEKNDILFKQFQINYNNELEQFKKGTIVVNVDNNLRHYHRDFTRSDEFWLENSHIFDDYGYERKLTSTANSNKKTGID